MSPAFDAALIAAIVGARKASGLSQRQLAQRLGRRAHSFVGKVESGARQLIVREFCEVAIAVGVDPPDLLTRALAERGERKTQGDAMSQRATSLPELRISRDLDASKGGANPQATLPSGGKSKAETLRAAGISTSAAHPVAFSEAVRARVADRNDDNGGAS